MKKNDDGFRHKLVSICKYFKDEEQNPFKPEETSSIWWEGERQFVEACTNDPSTYSRTLESYRDAIKNNGVSGVLKDENAPENQRVLIFYLDIWHGVKFPYDDLDIISTY